MRIDLNDEDARALRELLQDKVREMDKQINATDSLRFKEGLRDEEHRLERILGAVSTAVEGNRSAGPGEWEPRDAGRDTTSR